MGRLAAALLLGLVMSSVPAVAQDIVMRRPLPVRPKPLEQTGAPTPTLGASGYYGWQPGCATDTPTAACVSIGATSDTVVDASQCPATQDAAGEALAHERGLFGMLDGVNAANRASVCGSGSDAPTSYFIAKGSCQGGGYTNIECTQAFVNSSGDMTARQALAPPYKCAAQEDTAEFRAFVAGPSGVALTGPSHVAPDMVYSSWGSTCDPTTADETMRVTTGQCTGDGGYVCTVFDVAKVDTGQYRIVKATPADANECYGNGNPTSGEADFIRSLGYYLPGNYSTPAAYCKTYDTYGADSACKTTVKQRVGGGYDIDTGLEVQCLGLAPSPWDPNYIMATSVATRRCEDAGPPTPSQLRTIEAAGVVTYDQARTKDCGLTTNIEYNYQWKVLPGDWTVNRSTMTYEYPTAAMRAAEPAEEGDQYGEYID